ncbi:MFS transporter [Thermobifida halotolerans]|uniref:MFS transporter n=2 Tax=Thermobifida halotolerans TaxID=483545 RepID=A0AA97M157_9ACTN|nr:MFS transporter [Thermobifida halotolerans]
MIIAVWASRIPEIKQQAGLNDGELSLALLGLAVGSLAAMQFTGRMVDRHGSAAVMLPAAVFASLALVGPGFAHSLPYLFTALVAVGFGCGMLGVPMNVHAARVERRYGRPIMASFHAAFSIGGFTGAAVGGATALLGLGAALTFVSVAAVLAVLAVAVRGWLLRGPDTVAATAAGRPARERSRGIPLRIVLFGAAAFCCMLAEGSVTDWAAVYLHDARGASGAVAALGFSAFSALMAAGRLVGDRLTATLGTVTIVRGGALLAAAGLALTLLTPWAVTGVAGFAIMGAGLSCVIPQVFGAAVEYDPRRAGRNLGFVSAMGQVGLLSGPVAIGAVAHTVDIAVALAVPATLCVAIALSASALRGAVATRTAPAGTSA